MPGICPKWGLGGRGNGDNGDNLRIRGDQPSFLGNDCQLANNAALIPILDYNLKIWAVIANRRKAHHLRNENRHNRISLGNESSISLKSREWVLNLVNGLKPNVAIVKRGKGAYLFSFCLSLVE